MKDGPLLQWAPRIHNAFANTLTFLSPSIRPLKSIGDELMFYVSSESLAVLGETPLCLYSGLYSIASERDPLFVDVKIATAYCENVYRLSFLPGIEDVYGKDIDLTARLLAKALPRQIVMNDSFVTKVRESFQTSAGNKGDFPEMHRIEGPVCEEVRGFSAPIKVFRATASCTQA